MATTTTTALTIGASQETEIKQSRPREKAYHALRSVAIPRAVLVAVISTALLFPSLWQPLLSSTWAYLFQSRFYNLSTFETIWILLSYAFFEIMYNVRFVRNPEMRLGVLSARARGDHTAPKPAQMRVPWKRLGELATSFAPLLAMDLTMIKKFAGVPLADIRRSGGYGSTISDRTIRATFLAPTLHNFSLSSPLQLVRALPAEGPTSRRLVSELLTSLLIYDSLFFLFHLSLHRIPFLKRMHAAHHNHAEMNPQITNQLDVGERLGLVLLANFSLNIIGSHVLTRTAFVPVFVYLLIEIHSGLDLPWGYEKVLPWNVGAGAKRHAAHHRTGSGLYEPFFCWWDKAWELFEGRNRAADTS